MSYADLMPYPRQKQVSGYSITYPAENYPCLAGHPVTISIAGATATEAEKFRLVCRWSQRNDKTIEYKCLPVADPVFYIKVPAPDCYKDYFRKCQCEFTIYKGTTTLFTDTFKAIYSSVRFWSSEHEAKFPFSSFYVNSYYWLMYLPYLTVDYTEVSYKWQEVDREKIRFMDNKELRLTYADYSGQKKRAECSEETEFVDYIEYQYQYYDYEVYNNILLNGKTYVRGLSIINALDDEAQTFEKECFVFAPKSCEAYINAISLYGADELTFKLAISGGTEQQALWNNTYNCYYLDGYNVKKSITELTIENENCIWAQNKSYMTKAGVWQTTASQTLNWRFKIPSEGGYIVVVYTETANVFPTIETEFWQGYKPNPQDQWLTNTANVRAFMHYYSTGEIAGEISFITAISEKACNYRIGVFNKDSNKDVIINCPLPSIVFCLSSLEIAKYVSLPQTTTKTAMISGDFKGSNDYAWKRSLRNITCFDIILYWLDECGYQWALPFYRGEEKGSITTGVSWYDSNTPADPTIYTYIGTNIVTYVSPLMTASELDALRHITRSPFYMLHFSDWTKTDKYYKQQVKEYEWADVKSINYEYAGESGRIRIMLKRHQGANLDNLIF